MADKISQLPVAAALTGNEQIPMVQGGATVKAPASSFFQSGLRNLLINALGQINQRGYVSGTATIAANQYTVDRWKVVTSGQSLAWATANGVATFTAPAGGVAQVVEGANVQGGTYVLSWSGNASCTVNGAAVVNGSPFALAANTDTTVQFSGGTFAMPQLERGQFPTRFDWRHFTLEQELSNRYCQFVSTNSGDAFVSALAYSTTNAIGYLYLPTAMRAKPAGTTTGVVGMTPPGISGGTGKLSVIPVSTQIMALLVTLTGLTVGLGGYFSASGGAQAILLDAEL